MRLVLQLKWSEGDDKWHLINPATGKFIYDFFDCENFNRVFDFPKKDKAELFLVDIKRYSEMNKNKVLESL